jgi:hypothetical protein
MVQINGLERLERLLADVAGATTGIRIGRSKRALRRLRLELERIDGTASAEGSAQQPRRRK